jgi:hypothetical protein
MQRNFLELRRKTQIQPISVLLRTDFENLMEVTVNGFADARVVNTTASSGP